jgi:uncharacterized membrane protein YoaK (UPF0700 family)
MISQFLTAFGRLTGKRRSPVQNQRLGALLAFIAGFVNAGGFFIVRQYTSHMTGILSLAADDISVGRFAEAGLLLGCIACFVLGAALTTILILRARAKSLHSQYSASLLLEAAILVAIVAFISGFTDTPAVIPITIAALCFLMGLQNALITKASGAVVRTAHVTGMSTDLGIELGRFLAGVEEPVPSMRRAKVKLFITIIATFFLGGIIGALVLARTGAVGLLPIAFLLMLISLPPIWRDIRFRDRYAERARRTDITE